MPKVLRIINRFNLGGPTYNAAYLTKYLAPEFETYLVGGMKDESEDSSEFILDTLGLTPNYLPNMMRSIDPTKDVASYRAIRKLIREFKPDIVHTHASKAGALGRYAAAKEKVPVIVHTFHGHVFHSYFGSTKTRFYKTVERSLARKSSRIIAISDIQKRELSEEHKICPADKINVINLGFDLIRFTMDQDQKRQQFREEYNVGNNELALGIVGRLVPIKNHRLFLDAIRQIANKHNHIRAFIVGDGELRTELEAYCDSIGLSRSSNPGEKAQVHFTSWIKSVDVVNAGLDVVCLTSLNEGTPVTLIEAQASSKPIVSTEVGGIRDIVLPDETALLSPSGDVEAYANNLARVIENEDLRQSMSEKGKEFALKQFSYTRLVEDMRLLYTELLEEVRIA